MNFEILTEFPLQVEIEAYNIQDIDMIELDKISTTSISHKDEHKS